MSLPQVEDISAELVSRGFSYSGKDYLTSGITGGRPCAAQRPSLLQRTSARLRVGRECDEAF